MAKAKNTAPATDAPAPVADPAAAIPIKVQGMIFSYPPKYFEGHVLSAEEAAVLNQTFGENLRNNFASRIRAEMEKIEEAATAAGETPRAFTQEEQDAFAADFTTYAATYTFKSPRVGAGPIDPVEREAHKIATALVKAKLSERNIKPSSLPEGKMEEYVKGALAKRPEIRDEARRRVEALQNASGDILDDM